MGVTTEELTKAAEAINTLAVVLQTDPEEIINALLGIKAIDEEEAGELKVLADRGQTVEGG